jgi:hypothetical protein
MRADGIDAQSLLPSGTARAKALTRVADPHAPPPTALAHDVHTQLRAVGSGRVQAPLRADLRHRSS